MENEALRPTPYIGLVPYSEADAGFFFGREDLQDLIIAYLQASRLTLLHGATGVGKSSVLRAGVIHKLRKIAKQNMARRGTPEFCVVTCSDWRVEPVEGLLKQISDTIKKDFPAVTLTPHSQGDSLTDTLRKWTGEIDCDLFVILDQFEEYFLYHPQTDIRFDKEFQQAANNNNLRVNFLISLREDALPKLDRYQAGIPRLFQNILRVEHLDEKAGRKAIEEPIAKYNKLTEGQKISIEPALIDVVLEQVAIGKIASGTGQIEAPYLQQVMNRLWDKEVEARSHILRLSTLQELGGARSIVSNHLSSTIESLSRKDKEIAAKVFGYLVTPYGSKIAQSAADLAAYSGVAEDKVGPVLARLTDVRILRPVAPHLDQPDSLRYEIFHDVLATPINRWWHEYESNKQSKARLMRVGLAVFAVLFIMLVGTTILAFNKAEEALEQSINAEKRRLESESLRSEAERLKIEADKLRVEAIRQKDIAEENLNRFLVAKKEAAYEREKRKIKKRPIK
jgi:hypothetical protein